MISCIALDDEPLALALIQSYAARCPEVELRRTFTRTSEARSYLTEFPVDLLFLDIRMPDISGIDFYKRIGNETPVIFTTAYSEFAVTGFDLQAVDYLLKPFTFERFQQAVAKALAWQLARKSNPAEPEQRHLLVRADYSLVKIAFDEILYIEPMDDYARIHIQGRKPVLTLMSMKTVQEKLPAQEFVRIHRSYIVSVARIEAVRGKQVQIAGLEIPIGNTYEEAFFTRYKRT
jgi:DNA-binding LytR/AlgR family response regulator